MSVWFCIPSGRPASEANLALQKWRAMGYKIALWRDDDRDPPVCDLLLTGEYPGYSRAVNATVHEALRHDPTCSWTICGGDDTEPDPNLHADEIARQCTEHFGGTFGILQPTGDSWVDYSIERICGSPWMGRDFCERAYGGNGPMWPEYFHNFNDNELQDVAIKLGCFWQRRDLTHMHHHWMRDAGVAPAFLARANSRENWDAMHAIYLARKRAGFPGHAPLPLRATLTA